MKKFLDWIESTNKVLLAIENKEDTTVKYPYIAWIKRTLRLSPYASMRPNIIAAYIVGSEAKGTANPDSDIDIALVVPKTPGLRSIKKTENYHNRFLRDEDKPHWNGKRVDFQFFYPDEMDEIESYTKIKLS